MIARGHHFKLVLRDLDGERVSGKSRIQLLQLQAETLGKIARGNAARLKRLHDAQRRRQLLRREIRSFREKLIERLAQKAILIECIDDEIGERVIAFLEAQ